LKSEGESEVSIIDQYRAGGRKNTSNSKRSKHSIEKGKKREVSREKEKNSS
jgi:hypothetical protein